MLLVRRSIFISQYDELWRRAIKWGGELSTDSIAINGEGLKPDIVFYVCHKHLASWHKSHIKLSHIFRNMSKIEFLLNFSILHSFVCKYSKSLFFLKKLLFTIYCQQILLFQYFASTWPFPGNNTKPNRRKKNRIKTACFQYYFHNYIYFVKY